MSTRPDLSTVKTGDTVWVRMSDGRVPVWKEATVTNAARVWLTVDAGWGDQRFRRDTGTHFTPGRGYGAPERLYTQEMRDWDEARKVALDVIHQVTGEPLSPRSPYYQDPIALAAWLSRGLEEGAF